MPDGYDPYDSYIARTYTFAAGSQVGSATLNAIQDGLILVSENLDLLAQGSYRSYSGSSNDADSPAPDKNGGWTVWVEKATNGTTEVVLDDDRDYRDRYIQAKGTLEFTAANLPGGASDANNGSDFNPLSAGDADFLLYTEQGSAGSGVAPAKGFGAGSGFGGAETCIIYARASDGALCMQKSSHAGGINATLICKFEVSPKQNHY